MSDTYDKLLDRFDEFKPSTVPVGMESFIDLIAQTLNGGVEQWIDNGYGEDNAEIRTFLKSVKTPKADELVALLRDLDPASEHLVKDDYDYPESEDELIEVFPTYKALEEWIYNDTNLNSLLVSILDTVKPEATASAESDLDGALKAFSNSIKDMRVTLDKYNKAAEEVQSLSPAQEKVAEEIREFAKKLLESI